MYVDREGAQSLNEEFYRARLEPGVKLTPYRLEYAIRVARIAPFALDYLNIPHPCDQGHNWVNVNGWLKCSRCPAVLGKA